MTQPGIVASQNMDDAARIGDLFARLASEQHLSPSEIERARIELNRLQGKSKPPVYNLKGADVASAAALDLTAGNYFHVTGTTTITSIVTRPAGEKIWLEFDGALTLTYNATNLILQDAANLTTAAGDVLGFVSEGSGNWREISRRLATSVTGDVVRITEGTASSSAQLDFTGLGSTYRYYILALRNIKPATDNVDLHFLMSTDNGANFLATNYRWTRFDSNDAGSSGVGSSGGDSKVILANTLGNASDKSINGEIRIMNMPSAANQKEIVWNTGDVDTSGRRKRSSGSGGNTTATAVNAVRLAMSSGNIASGTATLYGVK